MLPLSLPRPRGIFFWLAALASLSTNAQPFERTLASPSFDRWMYPHNATPGARPTAPVFGTLGDESGVDARHGQFLVAFDLASQVPTNLGPSRYLIRRCRLSATVSRDRSFVLDPTTDGPATYLPTNHPDLVPDPDPGRPVELFGAGYRNGFTVDSFLEDSPFGSAAIGERNAFAAGYDAAGRLVDVGNSVGKTNAAFPTFAATPFAVGASSSLAPGDLVPAGTVIDFELNLADPLVTQYLQEACHTGQLRLVLTSLQTSGFGGQPAWSEFHTQESVLGDPPRLLISGVAIRPEDTDGDRLPDDWEHAWHGSLTGGADADGDRDGLTDFGEWEAGTDPGTAENGLATQASRDLDAGSPRFLVRFRYAPSRHYDLMASADLRIWEAVAGAEIRHEPGSASASFSLPIAARTDLRFFRVEASPVTTIPR